jgi:hypothetical protein
MVLEGDNFDYEFTTGVNGQQRMLTSPWHHILPSLLSGARVALHSTMYMFSFFGVVVVVVIITFNIVLNLATDILISLFALFDSRGTLCRVAEVYRNQPRIAEKV